MIANTATSLIFFTPFELPSSAIYFGVLLSEASLTAKIETPEITRKLKEADPTIVDGPSSPGMLPRLLTVSMMLRKISGALDPRAMRVRLATVGFHTFTLTVLDSPVYGSI